MRGGRSEMRGERREVERKIRKGEKGDTRKGKKWSDMKRR